ncbi:homeodomain mating type protein alpha2 [Pleosporales sp. CAS-2024a]
MTIAPDADIRNIGFDLNHSPHHVQPDCPNNLTLEALPHDADLHHQWPPANKKKHRNEIAQVVARKTMRTHIDKAPKEILVHHFRSNAYPKADEISQLAEATQLTAPVIRRWFDNRRVRTKPVGPSRSIEPSMNYCGDPQISRSVSRTNLEALDEQTPSRNIDALALLRYIHTPPDQDSIPLIVVESIIRGHDNGTNVIRAQDLDATYNIEQDIPLQTHTPSSRRSFSIAGSSGSFNSNTSQNSFRSQDSRGPRRGRKLNKRWQNDALSGKEVIAVKGIAREQKLLDDIPVSLGMVKQCFVCGRLDVTFGHIFSEHFTSCTTKSQQETTFLREDQFLQHINGTHLANGVTKKACQYVLALCKVDNPELSSAALKCGFCGRQFETWAARQDHVAHHLKSGMCSSSWWPERLPFACGVTLSTQSPLLKCDNCGLRTEHLAALLNHTDCVTWSCRHLQDHHAIFDTTIYRDGYVSSVHSVCILCNHEIPGREADAEYDVVLKRHAELHDLRGCEQAKFSHVHNFSNHMIDHHGAIWSLRLKSMLESWTCRQAIEWHGADYIVRSKQAESNKICSSKVFIDVSNRMEM